MLKFFKEKTFKEHSQLAPMRVRYHFIDNLHITETRFILFLTKYDKLKQRCRMRKAHAKTDFSVNEWKWSKTLQRLERNSRFASFQVEVNSFQIEKTSVQVSAVPKLRHQHAHAQYLCWERVPLRPPPNRKLNANKIEQFPRPRLSLLCHWQKRESLGSRLVSKLIAAVSTYYHIVICTF